MPGLAAATPPLAETPDEAGDEPPPRPAPPPCAQCRAAAAKYRCPACDRRTCSSACVAAHKVEHGCTGKRPRAEFVAPLKAFTDQLVLRDYGLLEDVDAAVDRAGRHMYRDDVDLKLRRTDLHRMRISLARACAAPERKTLLVLAPAAMSLARSNSTRVIMDKASKERVRDVLKGKGKGKGKDKGKDKGKGKGKDKGKSRGARIAAIEAEATMTIRWHVEWHFEACQRIFVDKGLPEREVLGTALARLIENDALQGRATKHLLLPYARAGLDGIEVYLCQSRRAEVALGVGTFQACSTGPARGDSDDDDEEDDAPAAAPSAPPAAPPAAATSAAAAPGAAPAPPPPPPPPPLAPPPPKRPRQASDDEGEGEESSEEEDEDAGEEPPLPDPEELRAPRRPFVRLDKALTLQENLRNRAIVEFPVLYCALPEEVPRFEEASGT